MQKDQFKMSIVILLLGGFITKILGFVIRILFTREIGPVGISYYTMVMPTYSLFTTIATLGIPISISKLVSEGTLRSKKIVFTTVFFILGLNAFFVLFLLFSAPFIASNLLKATYLTPLIYAMAFTLPFLSLSSILKGYFLGKLRVAPNTISNIFEQIVRILFLLFLLPIFASKSIMLGVVSFILLNILSECVSIFTFYLFLPKNVSITKKDLIPDKKITFRLLKISLPAVSGRLIGNVGFFLEPILLTNLLLYSGYSSNYILEEYASYNAYAVSLLTIPSFFIGAICQILIPEVSKYHTQKNKTMLKRRLKQALLYSFILGFGFSITIMIFRNPLLSLLYKTTNGSDYIFVLAPFFVLFYLEAPLTSAMQAMDEATMTMKITLYGIFLKLGLMSILSLCHIGLYSLVISEIVNILFVVYFNYRFMKKTIQQM